LGQPQHFIALFSHRSAWADLHLLGQANTLARASSTSVTSPRCPTWRPTRPCSRRPTPAPRWPRFTRGRAPSNDHHASPITHVTKRLPLQHLAAPSSALATSRAVGRCGESAPARGRCARRCPRSSWPPTSGTRRRRVRVIIIAPLYTDSSYRLRCHSSSPRYRRRRRQAGRGEPQARAGGARGAGAVGPAARGRRPQVCLRRRGRCALPRATLSFCRATLSFYTATDCHALGIYTLIFNIAVIAVIFCRNDSAALAMPRHRRPRGAARGPGWPEPADDARGIEARVRQPGVCGLHGTPPRCARSHRLPPVCPNPFARCPTAGRAFASCSV
jgi:hypothetical protein